MKIVINIPDEVYDFTIQRGHLPYGVNIAGCIIDSIPLPKGHGDLIDRDVAYDKFDKAGCSYEGGLLHSVPVVIKASKQ